MDNKVILSIEPIEAKKIIYNMVQTLCNDYTQKVEKENLKYITDRIYQVISERHKGLTFKYFKKAIIEVETNSTNYRIVNVASILTALTKVLQ
jgi:hypothetical protein